MSGITKFIQSENPDNFNVAVNYAQMIFSHINNLKNYERVARSGTIDLPSVFLLSEDIIESAKIKALRWYIEEMEMLLSNTMFAIKYNDCREKLKSYQLQLKILKKLLPHIESSSINQSNKKRIVHIVPKYFYPVLENAIDIKENCLNYLNRNNLIFMFNDDADPDELIKKIKEDVINSG